MRMTEEAYKEMMGKREGWKPGRLIFVNTPREDDELAGERPGEATPNPGHTAPPRQPGKRSAAAKMRTERQALQKQTGEVVRKQSDIEIQFAKQIHLLKLPTPKRNYLFIEGRRFELDFAWPELRIGVAAQGMAHRIKKSFHSDIEWRALALLAGWSVLEVGGREIRNGKAIQWLQQLLNTYADKELVKLGYPL